MKTADEVVKIFEEMKRFDGEKWLRLMKEKLRVPTSRKVDEPDLKPIDNLFPGKPSFFLPSQGNPIALRAQKKPQPQKSFGYVGSFVRLESTSPYVSGIIGVRFDPKKLGAVDPQTLRIFHWNTQSKQYLMIPESHVVLDNKNFVWANISRPGHYALIGLNTTPQALWTIRALTAMGGFIDAVPSDVGRRIRERLCRVILCASELRRVVLRPGVAAALADSLSALGHDFPSTGFDNAADVCDLCLDDDALPPERLIPSGDFDPCAAGPWESLGPIDCPGPVADLAIDPTSPTRIFAACHDAGIWRLDNFERYPESKFRPLTDLELNLRMQAVAVSRTGIVFAGNFMGVNKARLLRSAESGGTGGWRDPSESVSGSGEPTWKNHIRINRIITDSRDENVLFLASYDGFKRSSDGGQNWGLRLVPGRIADAARDPGDETRFYLAIEGRGLVRCVIGDGTSEAVQQDLLTLAEMNALVPAWRSAGPPSDQRSLRIALGNRNREGRAETTDRRTIAAKSGAAVFLSRNSGEPGTWALVKEPTDGDQIGWNNCIAIDPSNSDIILSGNVDLIRSPDAGVGWTGIGEPAHADRHCLLFHSSLPNVVFVASDGGVNLSLHSGDSWQDLNRDFVTGDMISLGVHGGLAVSNFDHQEVWGIHRFEGRTWEYIGGHEYDRIHSHPDLPNRFYWGRNEGLYRLKRDGSRWTRNLLSDFDSQEGALATGSDSLSRAMLACGGNRDSGKLYLTLDCDPPGGEWRADTSPMIPHGEWTEALSLTGPGDNEFKSVTFGAYDTREAYAVTLDGRVYYSADVLRSGSWSELRGLRLRDRGLRKLGFGTALYSLSSSGLRRMGINPITGANWLTLPIPMATDIYQFMTVLRYPADENIIYLASSSGLFSTRDDGREWIGIDGGLPHAAITGITHDAGYLYVSTYGRGLWRKRMGCI